MAISGVIGCAGADDRDGGPPADAAPADGDVDVDEAAVDAAADEGPSPRDAEAGERGGPLTFVVDWAEFVPDRACDLDGNGLGDNTFADLGSPGTELVLMVLNSALQGALVDGTRTVAHMPWVDDVATPSDPSTRCAMFSAEDVDSPDYPSDDFSGSEPFRIKSNAIDACGEPLGAFPSMTIDEGVVTGDDGSMPLFVGAEVPGRAAKVSGTIAPRGASMDARVCAYMAVSDLGGQPSSEADISALEAMLAIGLISGIPGVTGLEPDVDVDGDGLERFVLDGGGRIESCIDGDLTEIAGRDCWADDRIVDGLSITWDLHGVPAVFEGLEPDWEEDVEGTCEAPPDPSFWDHS